MSSAASTIRRVTLLKLRVSVPVERVNCPPFAHETLQRGPSGGFDGPWFGDVPLLIAKVEGDGGPVGWGDLSRGQELEQAAQWARRLIGLATDEIAPERDPINETNKPRGLHSAALDWKARRLGVPLWRLFGERVREGLPTSWWSGHRTPQGAARIAREARSRGMKCLKLKSSLAADDAGIAQRIAEFCGDGFELVIDPNGRWETFDETLRRAEAIRRVNRHAWLEDPIYGNNAAIAEVGRRTGVPMIKTVTTADAVRQVHALGFCGLNLVGPWPAMLAASRAADELGLPFWAGSAVDTGLSDLATVHFGVTQPASTMPAELAGSHAREHSLLREPIPSRDGVAFPPDAPGLGIEPDPDAIERYRVADPVIVE